MASSAFAQDYLHTPDEKAHKNVDHSPMSLAFYGQIEKMALFYGDGRDSETNIVDNSIGGTVFGVEAERTLEHGLTASMLFEVSIADPTSGDIQQNATPNQSSTPTAGVATFAQEFARLGLAGDFGALFIGQQDMAADGTTKEDLGGASDLLISETTFIGGNILFRNSATGASTGVLVSDAMTNNDEENLVNGVRYNSPVFDGFQLNLSAAQGGTVEAALRYAADYEDFEVSSALGYKAINDGATAATNIDTSVLKGSLSVKHKSGLAGSVAYGKTNRDKKAAGVDDATSYYAKISYEWDNFAVAADYGLAEDKLTSVANSEAKAIGVAGTMDMGHGVSTGVMWRQFSLDDATAITYDDVNIFALNLRIEL